MPVREQAGAVTRDEEADRHWAVVSNVTRISADHRRIQRLAHARRARVRVGLALVRLGLAVAPIGVEDVAARCQLQSAAGG